MIVFDIETSGSSYLSHGIWQIGAVDTLSKKTFLQEARIDAEDSYTDEALRVTGVTLEELRNPKRQSQKDLIKNFFEWVNEISSPVVVCHNPQFDVAFVKLKAEKYGIEIPFGWKALDTHSLAVQKLFDKNISLDERGIDSVGLTKVLWLAGIQDTRKEHNALEDAKLTAEAVVRLLYGRKLFDEYEEFDIPK